MGQTLLGSALSSWFTSAPKEPPIAKEHTYDIRVGIQLTFSYRLLKIALERPQAVAGDQSSFLLEFVAKIRNEIIKPLTTFTNIKDTRRKEVARFSLGHVSPSCRSPQRHRSGYGVYKT
jgi:hypothetical protein